MTITILQDHTDFFERMLAMAMEHNHGLPLTVSVLNSIRSRSIVCRFRGQARALGDLRDLANTARGAERDAIARSMAAGVEGEMLGWFCVADDEGVDWLERHHVGPVLRWNGAVWWGRLKDIPIDTEVVNHDAFKARKRRRPGRRPAKEGQPAGGYVGESRPGLRRPDMSAPD